MENKEFTFKGLKINGFLMILVILIMIVSLPLTFYIGCCQWLGGILFFFAVIFSGGFVMLEPNEAKAFVFFGKYKGTFCETGLNWVNPFLIAKKISLRARNLNGEPIKVNDKNGNPILIGLVLVWKVENVYKALFEIDSQNMAENNKPGNVTMNGMLNRMNAFEEFVRVQSDAALRQVAGEYAYDSMNNDDKENTLRASGDEINNQLAEKLNERLAMAGIQVVEARINYLAYAPEIAAVMLRRQQADAIIAAREKIVEGAVSMVQIALKKLSHDHIIELDEDKKATMVSNLLVILCGDESAQPVINTGTLHQ
ncbi:MAG: SPFH domain-containing protein [Bacteroidales bacterium]